MRACFQGNQAPRYLRKGLFHPFRCGRNLLLQNNFPSFIQYAIERPTIPQIQTESSLWPFENICPFENIVAEYLYSANLLHRRSPSLCATSALNLGSVSHPAETGLLIPSVLLGPSAREIL